MKDAETLEYYKITDNSIIHLVAKSIHEDTYLDNTNLRENNSSNHETQDNQESNRLGSIQEFFPSIIEFPIIRANTQRRRRVQNFDISDCFESLHQNISNIENLKKCRINYDEEKFNQTRTLVPFDFNKAFYEIGQWVDVKDTIDQWLEAQVIQVKDNQAFVHYNGWGTRWDEWINFNSPRIAPFRTYTVQSSSSLFLSPNPNIPCDANVQSQERLIDSFYYLEKCSNYMEELNNSIKNFIKLRRVNHESFLENKEKVIKSKQDIIGKNSQNIIYSKQEVTQTDLNILFQTSQLIPMLDRCGRLFSDVSLYLSHVVLNPSMCNRLLLDNNKINENKDKIKSDLLDPNNSTHINNENANRNPHPSYNLRHSQNPTARNQPSLNNTNNYCLSHSSAELPFIQRLIGNQTNMNNNDLEILQETWPKLNLQVPTIISDSGASTNNYHGGQQNIDIYVQTFVTSPVSNNNQTQNFINIAPNTSNVPQINRTDNSNNNENGRNFNIRNLLDTLNGNNSINTNNSNNINNDFTSNDNQNRRNNDTNQGLVNSFYQEESTQTELSFPKDLKNNQNDKNYHQSNILSENSNYEECDEDEYSYDIDDILNFR